VSGLQMHNSFVTTLKSIRDLFEIDYDTSTKRVKGDFEAIANRLKRDYKEIIKL
jgi:hypothetical protein